MKQLGIAGVALAVFGTTALAGPGEPQAVTPTELPPACCPAALPASRAAALLEVIKLERRLAAGVPAGERKPLLADIDMKIAALDAAIAQDSRQPMPCMVPPVSEPTGQQVQQNGDTVTITIPGSPAPETTGRQGN